MTALKALSFALLGALCLYTAVAVPLALNANGELSMDHIHEKSMLHALLNGPLHTASIHALDMEGVLTSLANSKNDASRIHDEHPNTIQFRLSTSFGEEFHLALEKNDLFSPDYTEREIDQNGNVVSERSINDVPHCHYRGRVINQEDTAHTSVAVSLCDGIRGTFSVNGAGFLIEPLHRHAHNIDDPAEHRVVGHHIVYRKEHLTEVFKCAADLGADIDHDHDHNHNHLHDLLPGALPISDSRPHMKTMSTAVNVIELIITNDKLRYDDLLENTQTDSATIVNIASDIYFNGGFDPIINLNFKQQDTFITADPFTPIIDAMSGEADHTNLLTEYENYRAASITTGHDAAHLLTHYDLLGGVVGFAHVNAICNMEPSGIDMFLGHTDLFNAATLAHELGHNLGFRHDGQADTPSVSCASSGFIMESTSDGSARSDWSNCSLSVYAGKDDTNDYACLTVFDTVDGNPVDWNGASTCGNGFVEDGEACDCGSNDCSTADPCCNGATCQLAVSAECSSSEPCCSNSCQFLGTETICRAAAHADCDVAEKCTGSSGSCPDDIFNAAGNSCSGGSCFRGQCRTFNDACIAAGYDETCNRATIEAAMNNNNEDDYCFAPVCRDEEPTCYITSENNDNTRCYTADDSVGFCLDNECKTPEEAHTAVNGATWVTGSYSDCNCTVDATRTVECQLEGGTVVDNDLCMSSTKPASKAKCETLQQNLDCPEDESEKITIAGQEFEKMHVYYAAAGAGALLFLCLCCCCCKSKKKQGYTEGIPLDNRTR